MNETEDLKMTLLVGATGNIGKALVALLIKAEIPVRALIRNSERADGLPKGIEVARGDLSDPSSLDKALMGVDKAFLVSSPDPRSTELQGNFIDAAKRSSIKLLVKSSVYGAQEPTEARFIKWYKEIEDHLLSSQLPYTLLRPNLFFQTLLASAQVIQAHGILPQPQGTGAVSAVDVRDIAAVAFAALTQAGHIGKACEVTGPEALNSEQMAEQIGASRGAPVKYLDVSPSDYKGALTSAGLPPFMVEGLAELEEYYKQGRAARVTDVVRSITGKPPRKFSAWALENSGAFKTK